MRTRTGTRSRHGVLLCAIVVALCAGCAGRVPSAAEAPAPEPHPGDAWFEWRAATLAITPQAARERDAALPDGSTKSAPPAGMLDAVTAAEGRALWDQACASCHGSAGTPPAAASGPRPRAWGGMGPTMGFLFGGDAMRAGIYQVIAAGRGTAMPAFGDTLSREQIWALVAHIEGF